VGVQPNLKAPIPLSKDQLSRWRDEIGKARELRAQLATWWDANLKRYAPSPKDDPDRYGEDINTNRDFTLVERKKADLFYQSPKVSVQPSPLMAQHGMLLDAHAHILNEKLGPDGVNAKRLAHQVLFDVLCPAGTGFTVMGYEQAAQPVDPSALLPPGAVLGLQTPAPVQVPVFARCFWEHISPRRILVPASFRSTCWDEAPWLGYEGELPLRAAKRLWSLPEDFRGGKTDDQIYFDYGLNRMPGDEVVRFVKVWYKSALYRDDVIHPQHLTVLVLVDGLHPDEPVEHRENPDQTLDDHGKLTPDSMIGFPIHPCTPRVMTDAAFVPSDCTVSRPLVNELNRFREQMVEFRDASILRWMYNTDTLPPDALSKIVRSPVGGMIGVPGEAFVGEGAIKELPHGSIPRENFQVNDYIDNDIARTHAMDSNQSGVQSSSSQTATEAQLAQANVNARLDLERGMVLDWYLKGVTKYSTLIQRYLSVQDAAQIVGPEAAAQWDQWRKAVPAHLAFTALPDSALRTDQAWERKRAMEEYTFFANDPFINRLELLKGLVPRLHYDQKVINAQPPEKSPEPTKPGLSLKGEDLNPLMPQFPILVEVLGQCGIKISPQAIQQAQSAAMNQLLMQSMVAQADGQEGGEPDTEHGGKVAQMESLSKHAVDETGGMQGSGAPAPMGAGGIQ
jgi:hypothetical protein